MLRLLKMKHREGRDEKYLNIFEDIYVYIRVGIANRDEFECFFFMILKIVGSFYEEILVFARFAIHESN